jgi:type I restriction enzyme S subunit
MRFMPLKRVARIITGQSPPSHLVSDFDDGQRPFLQGNAEFGAIHPVPRWQCDAARKQAEPGDILLSVRAPVGALNWADRHYGIGRGLCAIRAEGELEPRFAWWMAQATTPRLAAVATGSTYDAVAADDVRNLPVPVPVWETQIAIADFLDSETERIDALVAARERQLILLCERHRVWLDRLVEGTPRVAARRLFTQIDQGWSAIADETPATEEGEAGVLRLNAVDGGRFFAERNKRLDVARLRDDWGRYVVRDGDLLVSRASGSLDRVGEAALAEVDDCGPTLLFPDILYRMTCGSRIRPPFAALAMQSSHVRGQIRRVARGAANNKIRAADLRELRLPLPDLSKQCDIVEEWARSEPNRRSVDTAIKRQIALLRERRQALITEAATGRLRVPGVSNENAAV